MGRGRRVCIKFEGEKKVLYLGKTDLFGFIKQAQKRKIFFLIGGTWVKRIEQSCYRLWETAQTCVTRQ